ncbi:MAG: hypothetical protein K6E30_05565 [Lachnospiraceae bacterium]|nr:hypothetical protein [Lachnospiraceae bacterium]
MLNWDNVVNTVVLIGIVPLIAGGVFCMLFRIERSLASFYSIGMFLLWAIEQLFLVPCIFLNVSFRMAAAFFLVIMVLFVAAGVPAAVFLVRGHVKKKREKWTLEMVILYTLMWLLVGFIMYKTAVLRNLDMDDATYVVHAVDMVRTDTMFRTTLTGLQTDDFLQFIKYLVSPWPFFGAFLSFTTGIRTAAVFHAVIPQMIILLATAVYHQLGEVFFPKERVYRPMFVIFVWLFNLFGYVSIYSAETFLMMRSWQGKAVVAGVGVPMMIWVFQRIYEEADKYELFILLAVMNFALCFMSGVGLAVGAAMTFIFGVVYAVIRRKIKIILYSFLALTANIIYGAFYICLR